MPEIIKIPDKTTYQTEMDEIGLKTAVTLMGNTVREVPNINFSMHSDEFFLNFNYTDMVITGALNEDFTFENNRLDLTKGDETFFTYPLNDTVTEAGIIFASKPIKTKLEFAITGSKEFDFYPQGELTQDEINNGANRPDNVVGSIAVYHDKSWNKYRTGKFCHMFRWECIDDDGKKEWCGSLSVFNGVLSMDLPAAFLSTAKYPVTCMGAGDTFGNIAQGLSDIGTENYISGTRDGKNPAANGTANSIKCYILVDDAAKDASCALYLNDLSGPIVNGDTDEVNVAIKDGLQEFTYSTQPTVLSATAYDIVLWADGGPGQFLIYYDDIPASAQGGRDYDNYNLAWPDPWVPASNDFKYSIWCDFTITGGGLSIPIADYNYRRRRG